jgi:hypothetical protein
MSKVIDNIEDIASIDSKSTISYVDSKPTGFKNYIINGNFDIWQRGTSQTSSGYGSDDRWNNWAVTSTKTHSQVACTDTEIALFNASYFSRTVVSHLTNGVVGVGKNQNIENVTLLAGKTITISFWIKADANKNISIQLSQNFGTGGTPSSTVDSIGYQLVALTTTWQKKTITVTLPSIIGKTIGTDGIHTTYTTLNFVLDSSVLNQSGTFDIAQVQLEEGSVATPFEQRPYGLELSLCQRYYEANNSTDATDAFWSGVVSLGSVCYKGVMFITEKRIAPSSLIFTPAECVGFLASNTAVAGITSKGFRISNTANATTHNAYFRGTYTASSEL